MQWQQHRNWASESEMFVSEMFVKAFIEDMLHFYIALVCYCQCSIFIYYLYKIYFLSTTLFACTVSFFPKSLSLFFKLVRLWLILLEFERLLCNSTESFRGFLRDNFWFSGSVLKSRFWMVLLTVLLEQEIERGFHWNLRFNRKQEKKIKILIKGSFPHPSCKCSDNSIEIGLGKCAALITFPKLEQFLPKISTFHKNRNPGAWLVSFRGIIKT